MSIPIRARFSTLRGRTRGMPRRGCGGKDHLGHGMGETGSGRTLNVARHRTNQNGRALAEVAGHGMNMTGMAMTRQHPLAISHKVNITGREHPLPISQKINRIRLAHLVLYC